MEFDLTTLSEREALEVYQRESRKTATHPMLGYFSLGMVGEAAELWEKTWDEGGWGYSRWTEAHSKELGDVLWYVSQICEFVGKRLPDLLDADRAQLNDEGPESPVESLLVFCSLAAEPLKKIIRDDEGQLTPERWERIEPLLSAALREIGSLAELGGGSLQLTASENLQKIFDRRDRGVTRGDGDFR